MKLWETPLKKYATTVARESGRMLAVLATNDGARMKVDWLLDVVFVAMVDELAERGVPRRVAADMLGVSHRTLQRRYAAALDAVEVSGRSVWTTIVEIVKADSPTQEELTGRLKHVQPVVISSVLNNMVESGWVEDDDGTLRVVANLDRGWDDERLERYIEVRRRTEPGVRAEQIAEDLGLELERVETVWEMSETIFLRVTGSNAWMAMEQAFARTMRLLRVTADQPQGTPNSATTWRVRLDDKPQEFQDELLEFIHGVTSTIKEKVAPIGTNYGSGDPSARFWLFTAFQSHDE